jgi:hypothetical protein
MSGNTVASETAWSGSGGGVSAYETEPFYQVSYNVPGANGKRAVPDVSYDADPYTGFPVYDTTPYGGQTGWFQVGGTSAGAPQWAAIQSLGETASNNNFYQDAKSSSYPYYFRDITAGSNGEYYATTNYDLVTGLGSPLTTNYLITHAPTINLLLTVEPIQVKYTGGQSVDLIVTVFNQLNPSFDSTLTLTVTGPSNYYYFDFQTIAIAADTASEYGFSWTIPDLTGTYVVEVSLIPLQLTAYDAVWLEVT